MLQVAGGVNWRVARYQGPEIDSVMFFELRPSVAVNVELGAYANQSLAPGLGVGLEGGWLGIGVSAAPAIVRSGAGVDLGARGGLLFGFLFGMVSAEIYGQVTGGGIPASVGFVWSLDVGEILSVAGLVRGFQDR